MVLLALSSAPLSPQGSLCESVQTINRGATSTDGFVG
jgi:hypothetical protein